MEIELGLSERSRLVAAPPGPSEKLARGNLNINILQINIAGLQNKTIELQKTLADHKVHVAVIQETILPQRNVTITGYSQYRCECTKCQGIMTLIRKDIEATVTNNTNSGIDHQTIQMWPKGKNDTKITIHNIYCPPSSQDNLPTFQATMKKTIIAGDFNAHSPSLGYTNYNPRGHEIEELCHSTNLCMLQNKDTTPTLLHRAHGTTSRPDLTFVTADIKEHTSMQVLDGVGSDHRPILTTISLPQERLHPPKQATWNFRKAKWRRYAEETDTLFGLLQEDQDMETLYKQMCSSITTAAKKTIPRGRRKKYKPHWTPELEDAVFQR